MADLLLQKLLVFNVPIMLRTALHRFVFDKLDIRHLGFDRILTIFQNKQMGENMPNPIMSRRVCS